ncbi:MAG TPA: VOC family protein [Caulobacteraceae bacterium]|nr:VOC family protein [Caulobacteraceae bacterium]
MSDFKRPSITSGVCYRDPRAALTWLEQAFGFEPMMVVVNEDGTIGHSEMRFGDSMIFVGQEWDADHKSPASLGGKNTQSLHLQVDAGIDALFERAVKAGARPLREPADQFYGDRSAMVSDPEGHVWSFGQTIREMSFDEMSKAGGHHEIRERL